VDLILSIITGLTTAFIVLIADLETLMEWQGWE
jgi:hypothetical protein